VRTIKICPECGRKTSYKFTTCRGCGASLDTIPIFNAYRTLRSTSSSKPISDAEIMEELGLNDEKFVDKLKERYGHDFLEKLGIKKGVEERKEVYKSMSLEELRQLFKR
jgi:hypothetical protein